MNQNKFKSICFVEKYRKTPVAGRIHHSSGFSSTNERSTEVFGFNEIGRDPGLLLRHNPPSQLQLGALSFAVQSFRDACFGRLGRAANPWNHATLVDQRLQLGVQGGVVEVGKVKSSHGKKGKNRFVWRVKKMDRKNKAEAVGLCFPITKIPEKNGHQRDSCQQKQHSGYSEKRRCTVMHHQIGGIEVTALRIENMPIGPVLAVENPEAQRGSQ